MINDEYRGTKQWSRNKQAVFTVAWISFLMAAFATMMFFAIFDPIDLGIDREIGYAVGFFFFWSLCALCSGITAYLVRTAPKRDAKHREQ